MRGQRNKTCLICNQFCFSRILVSRDGLEAGAQLDEYPTLGRASLGAGPRRSRYREIAWRSLVFDFFGCFNAGIDEIRKFRLSGYANHICHPASGQQILYFLASLFSMEPGGSSSLIFIFLAEFAYRLCIACQHPLQQPNVPGPGMTTLGDTERSNYARAEVIQSRGSATCSAPPV